VSRAALGQFMSLDTFPTQSGIISNRGHEILVYSCRINPVKYASTLESECHGRIILYLF